MSIRLLVVGAELSLGLLLLAWGVASAARPALWRWRGARLWLGGTTRTASRVHGLGVGLIGVAVAVTAPAPLLIAATPTGGVDAALLELIGLVVVVLGGALTAASYPAPPEVVTRPEPVSARRTSADPDAAGRDLAPALAAVPTA